MGKVYEIGFWGFASSQLKYKSFLRLGLESFISRNIRNFFRVIFFFYFSSSEYSLLKFFNLGARKFYFSKYKKNFFKENIRTLLILGLQSSISWNVTNSIFLKKYKKYFLSGLFFVCLFIFWAWTEKCTR